MDYVATALTIVAGMAWNDAVKSAIETYVKKDEGTMGKFVYAIIITILGIIIIYMMRTLHSKVVTVLPGRALEIIGTKTTKTPTAGTANGTNNVYGSAEMIESTTGATFRLVPKN